MKNSKTSINISIGVLSVVALALVVLLGFGPYIFEKYMVSFRGLDENGEAFLRLSKVFGICFYSASVFAAMILYSLFKLLLNIKKGEVFIFKNATYLRLVSWCCFVISVITFIGGIIYMPLIFVAAAGVFTGVLLRVLKNVMSAAIELKQDNDLTI